MINIFEALNEDELRIRKISKGMCKRTSIIKKIKFFGRDYLLRHGIGLYFF